MSRSTYITCLECDTEIAGVRDSEDSFEYPEYCPSCNADLASQAGDPDYREDFHSDG